MNYLQRDFWSGPTLHCQSNGTLAPQPYRALRSIQTGKRSPSKIRTQYGLLKRYTKVFEYIEYICKSINAMIYTFTNTKVLMNKYGKYFIQNDLAPN